ncbi:MAG: sigma factor-like helix-turn-helix DNA-binding protein [Clostridia bacterium]|nr:sigma factor-like helix-turn-helix DNA-binding protein [Clostridia bacterium]
MKNIAEKIRLAKTGNEEAMMEILDICNPMIRKYTRLLNYDEDCKSELVLKVISLVKEEINLDKMENLSDGVMINYLSTALRNQYIAISVGRCRIRDNEIAYDQDSFGEMLEGNPQTETGMEDSILFETIKTTLTEREKLCVQRIVLEGWTAEALASALGITKQAVNQCKKRALEKLKKIYT